MRLTALCVLLLTACTAPSSRAETPLTPDSPLDAILDALHVRGKDLRDFTADVALHTVDNRTGEDSAQIGKIVYDASNGNSRIKVTFDKRQTETGDGKRMTQKQRLDYLLENGWLTDRDYQKKLEVRRQVLRPGQTMNLLKLGEGPFPLPIGQDKEEVKKQFDVSKIPTAPDDPKGTVHVRLVPKKGTQFEKRFRQIDVYVDPVSHMPTRIDTTERAGTTRSTELTNLKLNAGVKPDDFALPNIEKDGWNRREEPFE